MHEGVLIPGSLLTGGSPLMTSQAVTAARIAAGLDWGFYISNAAADKTVNYKVTFIPD